MPGRENCSANASSDAAQVAFHHRREAPAHPASVQLHVGLGGEHVHDVAALLVGQAAEVELVVVAQERRPLRVLGQPQLGRERLDQGFGVAASQGEPDLGVQHEVEQHLRAVVRSIGPTRGVLHDLSALDVGLAEQGGVAALPLGVLAPLVEDGVVHRAGVDARRHLFQDERCRVDPEPRRTQLQPERHDLA